MSNRLWAEINRLGLDGLLLWDPGEIYCFGGCVAENACLLLDRDGATLIAPEGTAPGPGITLLEYGVYGFKQVENPSTNLLRHLAPLLEGKARLGFTAAKLPLTPPALPHVGWVDVTEMVHGLMDSKPERFLPLFQRALHLNSTAYRRVKESLRAGMTELDVWQLVTGAYYREAGGLVPCTGDYLSGERTAGVAGGPTSRILTQGDPVILDALVGLGGAYADTTRTFFLGEPTAEQAKAYQAVRQALAHGESLLRPGASAGGIYREVSSVLEAAGYLPLPHHAGHGLGYSWYERPYFIPGCGQELREGMLVTLEPGVYLDGFGIRLENNYRITADGCASLLDTPLDLDWFIC